MIHCGFQCLRFCAGALVALALSAPIASAQLVPERAYYGVNRSAPMRVELPESTTGTPTVALYAPETIEPLRRATVAPGRIDLAALFPVLWSREAPTLLYAQLVAGEEAIGPAVVLQPLLAPPQVSDQYSDAIRRALEQGDADELQSLLAIGESQKSRLQQTVRTQPPQYEVLSGLHAWVDRHVVLETSAGSIELRLRPDHAPNSCVHFLGLVDGGFYNDTIVHRIIASDARGRPFIIQAGDPTGQGFGGPGYRIDFEPSTLPHDFGVVSLARPPFDPNGGGSQFFICLGREACAPLDGAYTSFAEVIAGAETLATIASVDVGPVDPDNPASPHERPLDPPIIHSARSIPAPPITSVPSRAQPPSGGSPR